MYFIVLIHCGFKYELSVLNEDYPYIANVYRNGCFLNFWPKCRLIRLTGSLCITKGIEPATKGTLFPPPLWFAGK